MKKWQTRLTIWETQSAYKRIVLVGMCIMLALFSQSSCAPAPVQDPLKRVLEDKTNYFKQIKWVALFAPPGNVRVGDFRHENEALIAEPTECYSQDKQAALNSQDSWVRLTLPTVNNLAGYTLDITAVLRQPNSGDVVKPLLDILQIPSKADNKNNPVTSSRAKEISAELNTYLQSINFVTVAYSDAETASTSTHNLTTNLLEVCKNYLDAPEYVQYGGILRAKVSYSFLSSERQVLSLPITVYNSLLKVEPKFAKFRLNEGILVSSDSLVHAYKPIERPKLPRKPGPASQDREAFERLRKALGNDPVKDRRDLINDAHMFKKIDMKLVRNDTGTLIIREYVGEVLDTQSFNRHILKTIAYLEKDDVPSIRVFDGETGKKLSVETDTDKSGYTVIRIPVGENFHVVESFSFSKKAICDEGLAADWAVVKTQHFEHVQNVSHTTFLPWNSSLSIYHIDPKGNPLPTDHVLQKVKGDNLNTYLEALNAPDLLQFRGSPQQDGYRFEMTNPELPHLIWFTCSGNK